MCIRDRNYNSRSEVVSKKLSQLSYDCRCDDMIEAITKLRDRLGIPASFQEAGISEEEYQENFELLLEHAMLGATNVNPVKVSKEEMKKMLDTVYYGTEIDF